MNFKNFSIENHVRREIKEITRQENSFNRSNYIRLDKNENLFSLDELFELKIKSLVTSDLLSCYTNLEDVYQQIATTFKANTRCISITAGADLAIKAVYETFISPGSHIVLPEYSYGMHHVYLKQFSANVTRISFKQDLNLDVQQILAIEENIKLVFIESPSGSTGLSLKDSEIDQLALTLRARNTLLVVDETYAGIAKEFLPLPIFNKNPNLLSIRSFSKNLGLAGLRVGLVFANELTISWLKKVQPMHEINSFASSVLSLCLSSEEAFSVYRNQVNHSKLIIKESINDKLYDLVIGDANFFLIRPKFKQFSPLNLYMKENGFLIKDPYDRGALKGYFRVTFGDEIQINSFLDHLNKFHLLHNPRDNKFHLDDK